MMMMMQMPDPPPTMLVEMRECAENCHECHDACLSVLGFCLNRGGEFASSAHIGTLLDCADICRVSEDFLHRGTARHELACAVCAEICAQCATVCARYPEEKELARCAEACRRCADSCRKMSASHD